MADHPALLKWYANLRSRTVDLVADYAGDELFIIEGDSLLLHSFSDDKLDFSPGFQLLHATYILENFLRGLHHRKCNFHLVFFKQNAAMCIPSYTPERLHARYLLAREAIIQHLLCNLRTAVPSIEVKVFGSYDTKDFVDYLAASGAYFLMCHDGASPEKDATYKVEGGSADDSDYDTDDASSEALPVASDEDSEISEDGDNSGEPLVHECNRPTSHKVAFRCMINWFVAKAYNIALLNDLECQDTKVMAMIVEGSPEVARRLFYPEPDQLDDADSHLSEEELSSEPSPDAGGVVNNNSENGSRGRQSRMADPHTTALTSNMETTNSSELSHALDKVLESLTKDLPFSPDITMSERVSVVALSLMSRTGTMNSANIAEGQSLLLHAVTSHDCRLSDRAVYEVDVSTEQSFFDIFVEITRFVLASPCLKRVVAHDSAPCDLADLIDGRLFTHILKNHQEYFTRVRSEHTLASKYDSLAYLVNILCGIDLQPGPPTHTAKRERQVEPSTDLGISKRILPFDNSVFNVHLSPVQLDIDKFASPTVGVKTTGIFKELSHWHNHKRPVGSKTVAPMTEKQAFFAHRRNQNFMAEMRDYAGSLTNAQGGVLKPETVLVQSSKTGRKKTGVSHGNHSAQQAIAATNQKKRKDAIDKQIRAWNNVKTGYNKESDLMTRFTKANEYLTNLPDDKRVMVHQEILAYLLSILVELWITKCASGEQHSSLHIAALIWDMVCRIAKLGIDISPETAMCVTKTVKALRLPPVELDVQPDRKSKLPSEFASLELARKTEMAIGLSPVNFQLTHAGPFFDRNMDSAPDPRVHDFEPDKWQRYVLDAIDEDKSLLVVAPTSAGKTFISFYAMKKILEEDDDGILVYVAPTKALVNQIAAEIQARFSKSFKHGGRSVWAIHTRDYRINNPTGCQVLVTVPHILQIMLLAPTNANSWSPRVKRIIFDEIHCIGQVDDGVVWEQLLLLSPCPVIALSATVGNPHEFSNWLEMTQKANDFDLEVIEHHHRYSDLRKYVYCPPRKFHFNGLTEPPQFSPPGLDGAVGMAFLHPVASLVNRSRGIPDDLTLEARDCWTLWNAMTRHQTEEYPIDDSLDPAISLPGTIRKVDIINWEVKLKSVLKSWIQDQESPFKEVLNELQQSTENAQRPGLQVSAGEYKKPDDPSYINGTNLLDTTLPLICSLHGRGALPALFFNYDRNACERICSHLLDQLEAAEMHWKESSPMWKAKLSGWEAWKRSQDKMASKKPAKEVKSKGKKNDEEVSREERMRDAASAERSPYESFDPDAPVDGFHLANVKKLTPSDFQEYAYKLRKRSIPEWLINALRRGIGVHHAGMNRKYRQTCEILFRKGYLRVVIATGTLALGINMPCKTVVFSGDSIFLTALNFRQAAGRAGRRGFDVLGNVVFQGVPYQKVCRLLSSRLPDLNGHFPLTTSLVLRLFTLLHDSGHAPHAVKMINSLLSCPRIYLGGTDARDTVLHHLRFSIEYLRQNHLLDSTGKPLNFAGCVQHLYYVENSSFAFHSLLKDGFFHDLCKDVSHKPKQVVLNLMLVMSHVFARRYLRKSELERAAVGKSPSVIVLPRLPQNAAKILRAHNKETLDVFIAYVRTFVAQHVKGLDCNLPLTGVKCGGDTPFKPSLLTPDIPAEQRINSAFVSLSGHRDEWESITDLCKMLRSGVWLEPAAVPYVGIHPEESKQPLNAYLYDFFKHGNVDALEKNNGIRKGDVWFLLNEFSMVLATIVTSFENFLKLSPDTDANMLDVVGGGEAHETELDQKVGELNLNDTPVSHSESVPKTQKPTSSTSTATAGAAPKKKKVAESWDDEISDAESPPEDVGGSAHSSKATEKEAINGNPGGQPGDADDYSEPAWENSGILQVLKAFKLLQQEFDQKFKEMWA